MSEKMRMPSREDMALMAFERQIENVIGGCGDPAHKPAEEACLALLKSTFAVHVIPERVREAVLKAYVTETLHTMVGENNDLGPAVAALVDVRRFMQSMLMVGVALRALNLPEHATDGPTPPTGLYI